MDLKTPVTILPCFKTEAGRTFDRKLKSCFNSLS